MLSRGEGYQSVVTKDNFLRLCAEKVDIDFRTSGLPYSGFALVPYTMYLNFQYIQAFSSFPDTSIGISPNSLDVYRGPTLIRYENTSYRRAYVRFTEVNRYKVTYDNRKNLAIVKTIISSVCPSASGSSVRPHSSKAVIKKHKSQPL